MSDNVRRDNRRALPKYLLTILLFGLLGGVLGFFTGVAGAAGVAETVRQALDRVRNWRRKRSISVCSKRLEIPRPSTRTGMTRSHSQEPRDRLTFVMQNHRGQDI